MKPFTIITLVTLMILFSACGPSPEVIATQTAVASAPKPGHWEGSKPPVTFDVTSDGRIKNFEMTIPFALDKCIITIDGVPIESDGTFVISEMAPTNSGGSEEVN